jgi:hypothetical protein
LTWLAKLVYVVEHVTWLAKLAKTSSAQRQMGASIKAAGVMVPNNMQVPVPFEYVFPHRVLGLRVEPVTDFDKRGQGDDQARDKATGDRLWQVVVMDLDPGRGGSAGRPR